MANDSLRKFYLSSLLSSVQPSKTCSIQATACAVILILSFQIGATAQDGCPLISDVQGDALRSGGLTSSAVAIDNRATNCGLSLDNLQADALHTTEISLPPNDRGKHAASVTVAQLAIPEKAQKALQKAWDALRKHRPDDARNQVASALTIWPDYPDAMVVSAILYLGGSQPDAAAVAAERAVALDATNGMAYIVLAGALNAKAQYDDALRALESGLRFRPDSWQAYFERARAEAAKKQYTLALADAARAGELSRDKAPSVHLLRASALVGLNRTPEAVQELRAYLRANPTGPTAEKARALLEQSRSAR